MRGGRSVDFELSLATDFVNGRLVGQLGHELISLNVDVLLAWRGLWRLDIASEEFLSGLRSLLLKALRVILALVRLEKLVGVGTGGNDHGGVGASTEHTLIVHDVLGVVRFTTDLTIRVLVFLLLGDDSRVGGEALAARAARLLHHIFEFYLICPTTFFSQH